MLPETAKIKALLAAAVLSVLMLPAFAPAAQDGPKLSLTMDVKKEVTVKRGTAAAVEYIPVKATARGDVLLYTITYRNEGKTVLQDAAIVDPVPPETVYILESAAGEGAEISCSIDGGKTFQKPPAMYLMKNPDGTLVRKPAPPEKYTHLKWIVKKFIQPGESGNVSFKVKIK